MVRILLERERKELEQEFSGSAAELLTTLSVNPETVIIVKNGEIVAEDALIEEKDEIRLLSVLSGG